jgi:hypothetical protein
VTPRAHPRLRVVFALTLIALLWLAGPHDGLDLGLLYLAPALLLALPLLAGRYVGEQALARVLTGTTPRQRRTSHPPPRRPRARLLPRGGRLVAHALASRAPPA